MKKTLSVLTFLSLILTCFGVINTSVRAEEKWLWPIETKHTFTTYKGHKGIDIAVPIGTPVRASKSGTLYVENNKCNGTHDTSTYARIGCTVSGCESKTGKCIYIYHGDGTLSCYMHLNELNYSQTTEVKQGDIIGYVGNTGPSTGPHLHFEIAYGNNKTNYWGNSRITNGIANSNTDFVTYIYETHTCGSYETYKNGNTKILGACKECHKAYNWQDTFSRITNQTASLKSSKKNYKINVYNAPYEDATKTTSKNPVEKFAIIGTVKNAYGNEWYAIDYPDDEKKVCYTAYIYSKTLTDNYDIITTTVQETKKYDSANTKPTPAPKPSTTTPMPSTPASISLSKSSINLDIPSKRTDMVEITLSGTLPSRYKLDFDCSSSVQISWGGWTNNSKKNSLTITATENTQNGSTATIFLRDDDGNTYATATIPVRVTTSWTSMTLKAPSSIGIDYVKNPTQKVTVEINGTMPNSSLQTICNNSISAEMKNWNGKTVDVYITANYKIKDIDGNIELQLVDKNNNVMDSARIEVYNTTPLYSVSYNLNGGYYPSQYDSDYLKKKTYREYQGEDFFVDLDAPSRDGYMFLGWSMNPNAQKADYQRGKSYYHDGKSDVVLYAVWEKLNYEIIVSEEEIYVYDADKYAENSPFDDRRYYGPDGNLAYTKKTALYGSVDLTIFGTPTGIYSLDWDCDDTALSIDVADIIRNGETTTLTIGGVVEEKNADLPVTIYLMDGNEKLCSKTITIHLRDSKVARKQTLADKSSGSEISVYVDGEKISFDVQPQLINDRTMVPFRAICEALNCKVKWDESNQTVIIENDESVVLVQINNCYLNKKNKNALYGENVAQIKIDTPPILYNDRTLVPVRAVSEALNMLVQWDEKTNSVNINTPALDSFIKDLDYDSIERNEHNDGTAQVALYEGNRVVLIANYIINGQITMIDYRQKKNDGTVEYYSLIKGSDPEKDGVWACLYLSHTHKDGILTYYDENGKITGTRYVN